MPDKPRTYRPPGPPPAPPPPRGTAHQRGYTSRWQRASKAFLRERPFCFYCELAGVLRLADAVDHAEPHKGDMKKFWDAAKNWRAACSTCNSSKGDMPEAAFIAKRKQQEDARRPTDLQT
jgi:5-methylcytosine-specific restriction enzyme A